MIEISDRLIYAVQTEFAAGRLSVGEIARRYRLPKRVVQRISKGKLRATDQGSRLDVIRQIEAYREQLLDPLGVFDEGGRPEPPRDDGEAELELDGAKARLEQVRRAKLRARRRNRVLRVES